MSNISFEELGLSPQVLKSIETLGYTTPSSIQTEIIPLILKGYDCVGQAQTGTGKTLAFAASILSKIDTRSNVVKAIVLVPTRELAMQVSEEFETLSKSSNFNILAVFGGSSIDTQIRSLKRGVDVVVGTPGRVMDLIKRRVLNIDNLEFFVLDEADEMLDMGFLEDIESIFKSTNENKQVLLFSATMPSAIKRLATKYIKADYQLISIAAESKTATTVKQFYYLVNDRMRAEALCRVVDVYDPKTAIIFCQRKSDCDTLLTEMQKRNYSVEVMHGDIAQNMRIQTLNRFKEGSFTYLIATDVAARGIHVENIDCVINYNLPQEVESYIHRIGRTGRAGKSGVAISLVTQRETRFLNDVERAAKCKIEMAILPTVEEIYKTKHKKIITKANEIVESGEFEECMEYVRDLNKDQTMKLAASLLKIIFDKEIGSDFKKDITVKVRDDRRNTVSGNRTRVFLTVGTMDNLKKGSLIDFIKDETGINKDHFQNIEVLTKFTFMDVDNDQVDNFIKKFYGKRFNNREIRVEKANKNR